MNWLVFFFALELGIVPQAGVLIYKPEESFARIDGAIYTELEAKVLIFNTLFVGGGVRTYITPGNSYAFSPNTTVYDFNTGLRFKDIVEIGWRHRCFHPTFSYMSGFEQELEGMEGSYDEIYLRIKGKIAGGKNEN